MMKAVQSWSWLRLIAVLQGAVVVVYFLYHRMDAQTATFWLVAAIFLWLVGETKPEAEAIYMPLEKKEE